MWDLIVSVPGNCLCFYFKLALKTVFLVSIFQIRAYIIFVVLGDYSCCHQRPTTVYIARGLPQSASCCSLVYVYFMIYFANQML